MMSSLLLLLLSSILLTFAHALPSPRPPLHQPRPATRFARINHTTTPRFQQLAVQPPNAPSVTAPKTNIFASLTSAEAAGVIKLLHDDPQLNLTATADAGSWDNWVAIVDTVFPNKELALEYLDGNGTAPPRFARVSINVQATEEPYIDHLLVGPLPITAASKWTPYTSISSKNSSRVRTYGADFDATSAFARQEVAKSADIVQDLLGAAWDDFDIWGTEPLPQPDGQVTQWLEFWGRPQGFDSQTILPTGLEYKVQLTGRDPSKWTFEGWFFNGVFYASHEAFRATWSAPAFEKPVMRNVNDTAFSGTDRVGDELPFDRQPPPMMVQPSGQRFSVDVKQKWVNWGPFSFFITFTRDTGMRLFDIRFGTSGDSEKKRIIYELGLDEAVAHYAGSDPVQSHTAYLDSAYGFGGHTLGLLRGWDCPSYANYLDGIHHANEVSTTHVNAICVFEADAGYLMQRHSSDDGISATRNIQLIVRSVSTIGNYDYTFDYIFGIDGSIETIVRASGYIQSGGWGKGSENYGYHLHPGLSGSMHDHVLTYRCDLDILGTANSFLKHSIVSKEVTFDWSSTPRNTMQLVRETIDNEDQGKLNWPDNGSGMYIIANAEHADEFGESPGYSIKPSRGGAGKHLTVQNSSNLLKSGGFVTNHLYVARRQENEPFAAHADNANDPGNPLVDFNNFFNGEDLKQQDLVLWFNLGMSHVPNGADLPNTVMTTAQSGVILLPHNYLANDASRRTRQMVRLTFDNDGNVTDTELFGATALTGQLNLATLQPDLSKYEPETTVRKFPWNPTAQGGEEPTAERA